VSARPPRSYVTQQQITDASFEAVARRDICVEASGSLFLLRPQNPRACRWLTKNGGLWPVTPAIVAGARAAGLKVEQP
jgi:hypothetical protein